jgi:hypothetical protein
MKTHNGRQQYQQQIQRPIISKTSTGIRTASQGNEEVESVKNSSYFILI